MKSAILAFIYALCAALAGMTAFAGVQTLRLANAKRAIAEINAANAQSVANAQAAARAAEQATANLGAAAAAHYEKGKADANTAADTLLADLLSVRVRLQPRWQCPTAAAVPGLGRPAAEPDAGAADRAASATRVVRAADTCVAQVNGLRALVCADRGKRLAGTECVR